MRFSFSSGDDLPHPKEVWKSFTRAVRSIIHCVSTPKTTISNKNCVVNIQHCCHCHCHRQTHKFPLCHSLDKCYSAIKSDNHNVNETPRFKRGTKPVGGHNYKNAMEEEGACLGEALMGVKLEGQNGNLGYSSSSERHIVDERAQAFIESFYDRLKLERQKSLEDYFEMLTRSA